MPQSEAPTRSDRIAGTLFGTAVGDALGFFVEGLPAQKIARRFGKVDRYLMPFGKGYLSDDTEQSALVAQALVHYSGDVDAFEAYLRWLFVKWFWTLPPGVGKATAQACLAMTFGLRLVSKHSAGNGAAMRAAILGVYFADDSVERKKFGVRAARITHGNDDAVDGALYVAEVAAVCSIASPQARKECVHQAMHSVPSESVHQVVLAAMALAKEGADTQKAAQQLGCSGYVLHTIALATFCFIAYGDDPKQALVEIISAGGDTDSNAAVLGAWLGALYGIEAFPPELTEPIVQGPIDLVGLTVALEGDVTAYGGFSYFRGLLRNLILIPFVLFTAFLRLFY